jgi:small GTP-binding protein
MDEQTKPLLIKIVIVGDSNTGKSSLLSYYDKKEFHDNIYKTIHVDFLLKKMDTGLTLECWDTAGDDNMRGTGVSSYFLYSDVIMFVFDVTNKQSFDNLQKHLNMALEYSPKNVPMVLIGNKTDSKQRVIESTVAQDFSNNILCNVPYFETSCKNGSNIDKVFNSAINLALDRINKQYEAPIPMKLSLKVPVKTEEKKTEINIEEKITKTVNEAGAIISGWFGKIGTHLSAKLFE